ncbi:MAG: hypothetical protein H6Q89_2984 [Myxococcaceae bacterium]|nr:hypothetical protein [Myxococcaceae bacterium]
MTSNRIVLLVLLAVAACSAPPPEKPREICGNGKDDDSNGFTDCQDLDCSGQMGCPVVSTDGGNFGSCSKCGKACVKQADCLTIDFQNDTPPPECIGGKCQRLNTNVQVSLEVSTPGLIGFSPSLRALNTRIVSKRALDGSAVTCLAVREAAMGKTEADADQIEKSGKFNLRGYDVSPLQASGGQTIKQPFVNVATGAEFLIWTEVWGGPVGTVSKLPSGSRYSWGCFESGAAVAEVIPADHCMNGDAGTCRTIKVSLTNPPE